jgi:hypothetical protein
MAFIGSGPAVTNLNASNLASGTVGTARLGSGTANSTTFLRGDNTWQTVASGGNYIMRSYTSPATWTKPAGIKAIKVTVVGGGGSAARSVNDSLGGAGGGGAAIEYFDAPVIPGPVSVTVGAGGAGVPAPAPYPTNGNTGGTSSFGPFCSATGGAFGPGSDFLGGFGGVGSGGTFNISGSDGEPSPPFPTPSPGPYLSDNGSGGSSILGGSTAGYRGLRLATNGKNYGGGGSGGFATMTGGGGSGGSGIVIVEEFY